MVWCYCRCMNMVCDVFKSLYLIWQCVTVKPNYCQLPVNRQVEIFQMFSSDQNTMFCVVIGRHFDLIKTLTVFFIVLNCWKGLPSTWRFQVRISFECVMILMNESQSFTFYIFHAKYFLTISFSLTAVLTFFSTSLVPIANYTDMELIWFLESSETGRGNFSAPHNCRIVFEFI